MSDVPIRAGSGVLIRVTNLDEERFFYRSFLKLGDPVVDSGFWVEFACPDGTRVILEKSEAAYLSHDVSATTLVLASPHLAAIRQELQSHNMPITEEEKIHPGEAFYRCQDPEGNVIYLCSI